MVERRQFCSFFLDGLRFGVDVRKVQEVVPYQEMTRVPLAPPTVRGLLNLRGQIVTGIDLRRRLDLPERPADRLPMNVVLRGEDSPVSFLVDDIGEVIEVDADACEPPPDTLRGRVRELIQGVYPLPDELLLVLDTDRTVNVTKGGHLEE
ncbi:MAG TPA: chemotaxis protein CheW [Gemmataceae bacterium]|jgi:purine-binding chemotaxis protein CheW